MKKNHKIISAKAIAVYKDMFILYTATRVYSYPLKEVKKIV